MQDGKISVCKVIVPFKLEPVTYDFLHQKVELHRNREKEWVPALMQDFTGK